MEHPRNGGKQKHEVTVEDVVQYSLHRGCPEGDLLTEIRGTYGMFSNISQRRLDEALAALKDREAG